LANISGDKLNSIKNLLQILLRQTTLTILFLFSFFQNKKQFPRYFFFSLTEEQALANKDLSGLFDFLNEDRFGFQATKKNSLIEIRSIKYLLWGKKLSITFDAAVYLLFRCLNKKELPKLYFEILRETNKLESGCLNLRDWKINVFDRKIWEKSVKNLQGELCLLTTQSSEYKLPSAFFLPTNSNLKKIMFWYGTNTEPLEFNQRTTKQHLNAVQLNQQIDSHYVWDSFQNSLLRKKGIVNLEVKESIIFVPRNLKKIAFRSPSLVYFDVTPKTKADSSYTEEFCESTLCGIVSVCEEIYKEYNLKIELLVKPKRKYRKLDSQTYIRFLEKLKDDKKIVILNENSNIYSLISSTNLTLGIAFTSPVLIAKELNVPGFFLGIDGPRFPEMYNEVRVLTNASDLKKTILSALNLNI
jgi:hypothetical protein